MPARADLDQQRFHPLVPSRPYPEFSKVTIQRIIHNLISSEGWDSLKKVSGIAPVPTQALPKDTTCYQFLLGEDVDSEITRLEETGIRTLHEAGAVAFYYKRGHRRKTLRHIGLVSSDGYVLSKWGDAQVFWHHPDFVLSSYGRIERYYRDPTGVVIERVRQSLTNQEDFHELFRLL